MNRTSAVRWIAIGALILGAFAGDFARSTEEYEVANDQPWMFWAGDSARIGWYPGSWIVAYPKWAADTTGNGTSLTAVVADSSYLQEDIDWGVYEIWEYWATGSTLLVDDYFVGAALVPPGAFSPESTYAFGYIDVGVATADYLTVLEAATFDELTVLNPPYFDTDTVTVEGATDDAYEGRMYFVDPTADRVWTFPNSNQTMGTATSLSGILASELSDVVSSTKTGGNLWIADGVTGFASTATTGISFTSGGVGSVDAAGYDAMMVAHALVGTFELDGISLGLYRWALYSSGLTASDIVIVSWNTSETDTNPVNTGTASRDASIAAYCKTDSIIFTTSGGFTVGDSLVNYLVIPQ